MPSTCTAQCHVLPVHLRILDGNLSSCISLFANSYIESLLTVLHSFKPSLCKQISTSWRKSCISLQQLETHVAACNPDRHPIPCSKILEVKEIGVGRTHSLFTPVTI